MILGVAILRPTHYNHHFIYGLRVLFFGKLHCLIYHYGLYTLKRYTERKPKQQMFKQVSS